jgi:hypothetical protein
VVFLVVTSIVAAVVFINLATVSPNWRDYYNREKDAYNVLATYNLSHQTVNARLEKDREDLREALVDQKTKAQSDIAALRDEKEQFNIAIADLKRQLAMKANITPESGKTMKEFLDKQLQALKEAWEQESKAKLKLVAVESQFLTEQAKNKRLENSLRVIKEQAQDKATMIIKLNNRISQLEMLEDKKPDRRVIVPVPTTIITGTVTEVNSNLVSINVGTAQGLKVGMQLIVSRGDKFVGYLKIEEIRVNEAAGIIVNRVLAPLQGDKVASRLSD